MCLIVLPDVEECQLSECGVEEELGGGDSPLPRSSSTSDIAQKFSDTLPGTYRHLIVLLKCDILWLCLLGNDKYKNCD